MDKNTVLDWLEYASKVIAWASGAARNFPVKEKNASGIKKPSPDSTESNGK